MRPFLFCCALLGCGSKQRPHDAALKTQILSGDKQPIVLPARAIDAGALDRNADMRRAAFEPTAADMARRAPHFALKLKVHIEGAQNVGTRNEEHSWRRAGNQRFSVRHASALDQVEWVVTNAKAFVRHGKNEWREKPYTLEHAGVLERDAVMPFGELMSTFASGIVTSAPQATKDNGRAAFRYSVSYDEKRSEGKTGQARAVALGKEEVTPLSLNGDLVVDEATGLLLSAEVKATLGLEPLTNADKGPTVPVQRTPLKVKLNWSLDGLGPDEAAKLEPSTPEKAIVDRGFERPTPEVLGFFGGVKKPDAAKEQDEED